MLTQLALVTADNADPELPECHGNGKEIKGMGREEKKGKGRKVRKEKGWHGEERDRRGRKGE